MSEIGNVPEPLESLPLTGTEGEGAETWEESVVQQLSDISGSVSALQTLLMDAGEADGQYRQSIQDAVKENNALLLELKELSASGGQGETIQADTQNQLLLYEKTQTFLQCGILLVLAFLLGLQVFKWFSGFLFRMFDKV